MSYGKPSTHIGQFQLLQQALLCAQMCLLLLNFQGLKVNSYPICPRPVFADALNGSWVQMRYLYANPPRWGHRKFQDQPLKCQHFSLSFASVTITPGFIPETLCIVILHMLGFKLHCLQKSIKNTYMQKALCICDPYNPGVGSIFSFLVFE